MRLPPKRKGDGTPAYFMAVAGARAPDVQQGMEEPRTPAPARRGPRLTRPRAFTVEPLTISVRGHRARRRRGTRGRSFSRQRRARRAGAPTPASFDSRCATRLCSFDQRRGRKGRREKREPPQSVAVPFGSRISRRKRNESNACSALLGEMCVHHDVLAACLWAGTTAAPSGAASPHECAFARDR